MRLHPVVTESDYDSALGEIERLWDADLDTPDGNLLGAWVTLVIAYEEKHYPIPYVNEARRWAIKLMLVMTLGMLLGMWIWFQVI